MSGGSGGGGGGGGGGNGGEKNPRIFAALRSGFLKVGVLGFKNGHLQGGVQRQSLVLSKLMKNFFLINFAQYGQGAAPTEIGLAGTPNRERRIRCRTFSRRDAPPDAFQATTTRTRRRSSSRSSSTTSRTPRSGRRRSFGRRR